VRNFHIAYTGDFLNEDGDVAYGYAGLERLAGVPYVSHQFLISLAPRPGDTGYWSRLYSLEVTAEHIRGASGVVVLRPRVSRLTFDEGAADLVVIGRSGAGYDKIDLAACTEYSVAVFNAPLALNHSTASSALMFMLALAKRLPAQAQITRQGRWDAQASVLGSEIEGRTLGIVGLGHSGRELVRLVSPFSMRLLAYSPHAEADVARSLGVRLVSLDAVLAESDFLSLHCRLTARTRRLIGAEQLAMMKPSAYLINVARGELVDQGALYRALRDQKIAGAALDVFEIEPLPANDPLIGLDNVILTPHWSASTIDVWRGTGEAMAEGMLLAARGRVPANVVNPDVLDQPVFQDKLARFRENDGISATTEDTMI
jgi:phosphoglycerate dehydrogenase-like enzyme